MAESNEHSNKMCLHAVVLLSVITLLGIGGVGTLNDSKNTC
jgi:hypothetical protein